MSCFTHISHARAWEYTHAWKKNVTGKDTGSCLRQEGVNKQYMDTVKARHSAQQDVWWKSMQGEPSCLVDKRVWRWLHVLHSFYWGSRPRVKIPWDRSTVEAVKKVENVTCFTCDRSGDSYHGESKGENDEKKWSSQVAPTRFITVNTRCQNDEKIMDRRSELATRNYHRKREVISEMSKRSKNLQTWRNCDVKFNTHLLIVRMCVTPLFNRPN